MQFTRTEAEIYARHQLAVWNPAGYWEPARVFGGKTRRSGATHWPDWYGAYPSDTQRIRSAHRLAKAARERCLGTRAHPGGRASGTTMIDRQHEPPLRRRAPFSRWRAARRWRQKGSGGSPAARPFAHKRHRGPFASDRIREGQNQPHRRSARRNWPGSNWPGSTCRRASLPAPTSWASAPG